MQARSLGSPRSDGFDPLWAEIAAIGRDDEVVAAAIDGQEAVRVEAADVACMPFARGRIAMKVAVHDRWAFDDDLAVFDRDLKARQRLARRSLTACARAVDRDHRAALGKSVSLINRDAQQPRALRQDRRNGRSTDGDKAKFLVRSLAGCHQLHRIETQELRNKNARRWPRTLESLGDIAGNSCSGVASHVAVKVDRAADEDRDHDAANEFEQRRQRQERKILVLRASRRSPWRASQPTTRLGRLTSRTPFGVPVLPDV